MHQDQGVAHARPWFGGGTRLYFLLAFAISWALQFPAVLAMHEGQPAAAARLMPLAALGVFGPMLAAILAARLQPEAPGVRSLLRPLLKWRVRLGWYVLALFGPGALLVVGMAVHAALTGTDAGPWLYLPLDAQRLAAMLVLPLAEEVGWRGYALPRLQSRLGALYASLLLGVLWAIWHLPMFLLSGISVGLLPIMVVFFVQGSIVYTWIYNRTGGSLLLIVLAHAGAHLNNSHQALPGNTTPLVVHTVAYGVVAFALVLFDRKLFRPASRS